MVDDRPMFDDEDLPDWLIQGGVTHSGKSEKGGAQPPSDSDDWLSTFGADDQNAAVPSARPGNQPTNVDGLLPWQADTTAPPGDSAAARSGLTGMLPWRQDDTGSEGGQPGAEKAIDSVRDEPTPSDSASVHLSTSGDDGWLSDLRGETNQVDESGLGDDWLTSVAPNIGIPDSASAPPEKPASEESATPIDDAWLSVFGSESIASAKDSEITSAIKTQSAPAVEDEWLASLRAETESMLPEMEAETSDDNRWQGTELETAPPAMGEIVESPSSVSASDDDWLSSVRGDLLPGEEVPAQSGETEPTPLQPVAEKPIRPPASEGEDWIKDFMVEDEGAAAKGIPVAEMPAVSTGEDGWLYDLLPGHKVKAADIPPLGESAAPENLSASADNAGMDVPDWFKEAGAVPAAPSSGVSTPASAANSEVPDWFAESSAVPAQETKADQGVSKSKTLPVPNMPATAKPEPAAPDWMASTGQLVTKDMLADLPPLPADDIPDWMRDVAPPPVPLEPPKKAKPDQKEDLSWLEQVAPSDTVAPKPPPAPAPAGKQGKAPKSPAPSPLPAKPSASKSPGADLGLGDFDLDALLNLPSSGALERERQEQATQAAMQPPEATPAKPAAPTSYDMDSKQVDLDELFGPEPTSFPEPEAPGADLAAAAFAAGITPDWDTGKRVPEGPQVIHIGDQEVRLNQLPLSSLAEPVRQLSERARKFSSAAGQTAQAPATGALSGIADALGPSSNVIKPGAGVSVASAVVDDMQMRRVRQLQNILSVQDEILKRRLMDEESRELEESVIRKQRAIRRRAKFKLDRLIIAVLLALSVVLPFFTDVLNIVSVPSIATLSGERRAKFDEIFTAIDSVREGEPVLFAFEYSPTGAGELDDLARATLREVIKRKARPVLISTNPSGLMRGYALIAQMGQNRDELTAMGREPGRPLTPGEDYIVLRYLPGGAAGVRALVNALFTPGIQREIVFGTDIQGKLTNLNDANLGAIRSRAAFVFTETSEDVRNWVEQYRSSIAAGQIQPLQMALLSTAGASITAETYSRIAINPAAGLSQDILGPLVGQRDALLLNQFRPGESAKNQVLNAQRWQSVGISAMMASIIILFGMVINSLRMLGRRRAR